MLRITCVWSGVDTNSSVHMHHIVVRADVACLQSTFELQRMSRAQTVIAEHAMANTLCSTVAFHSEKQPLAFGKVFFRET